MRLFSAPQNNKAGQDGSLHNHRKPGCGRRQAGVETTLRKAGGNFTHLKITHLIRDGRMTCLPTAYSTEAGAARMGFRKVGGRGTL